MEGGQHAVQISRVILMLKNRMTPALIIILLLGGWPVISLLLAVLFATSANCQLDEGSVHQCVVLGFDFGGLLYTMSVAGWLAIVTIPFAALAIMIWFIVLTVLIVRRKRRHAEGVIKQPSWFWLWLICNKEPISRERRAATAFFGSPPIRRP